MAVERLTPALAAEIRRTAAEMVKDGSLDAHQFGTNVALRLICIVAFGSGVLSPAEGETLMQQRG